MLASCAGPVPAPGDRPAHRLPFPATTDGPPTEVPAGLAETPDAEPRVEPLASRGNPPFYEVDGRRYFVLESADGYVETGVASWYGSKFHGRSTSSGEPYDMFAMTAAHRTLPLPTYARVTNLDNGTSIVVRINDRGPFAHDRVIDLSYAAAVKLDIIGVGTGLVEVRAIDPTAWSMTTPPPAPVGTPRLFVQVGAFAERANAESVATRLRDAHLYNVTLTTPPGDSAPLWRVRIGPLADVDEADAVALRVDGLGFPEARIVID
jgi:rare lipoprotein A